MRLEELVRDENVLFPLVPDHARGIYRLYKKYYREDLSGKYAAITPIAAPKSIGSKKKKLFLKSRLKLLIAPISLSYTFIKAPK